MSEWQEQDNFKRAMEPQEDEVSLDLTLRLFIRKDFFRGLEEWSQLDVLQEISKIIKDSKGIVKRGVVKSYHFPHLYQTNPNKKAG